MARLENWGIMIKDSSNVSDDFRFCLYGEAYEHYKFEDGTPIITKVINFFDSHFNLAKTSNNEYELGVPDSKFLLRMRLQNKNMGDFDR